ncbi:MAG: hypothetical protein HUK21_08675 [Fibrobacteraceae bacterium]|nr:hypothetical protein [Fibrobacteraceae bacterium]
MNCPNCKEELPFSKEKLAKLKLCPFCEKPLKPKAKSTKKENTVEGELQQIVDDFGGIEIFSEENENRLIKLVRNWEGSFFIPGQKLLVAFALGIQKKLFKSIGSPINHQKEIVLDCLNAMQAVNMDKATVIEIVTWLVKAMNIPCEVAFPVEDPFAGKDSGTFIDERDGEEYKWVRIGNQIWMAENLRYSTGGSIDDEQDNDFHGKEHYLYGRFYSSKILKELPMKGWHIPSKQEWIQLKNYVERKGNGEFINLVNSKTGWDEWEIDEETGSKDEFGLSIYPAGYNKHQSFGYNFDKISKAAYFWTSTDGVYYVISNQWDKGENEVRQHQNYMFSVRLVKDL